MREQCVTSKAFCSVNILSSLRSLHPQGAGFSSFLLSAIRRIFTLHTEPHNSLTSRSAWIRLSSSGSYLVGPSSSRISYFRSPHACAEPSNAVKRSRRKYHYAVARVGYSVVKLHEGFPKYPLTYTWQKNRGVSERKRPIRENIFYLWIIKMHQDKNLKRS